VLLAAPPRTLGSKTSVDPVAGSVLCGHRASRWCVPPSRYRTFVYPCFYVDRENEADASSKA